MSQTRCLRPFLTPAASATSPLRNPLSDIAVDRLHPNQGEYPGFEGVEDVDVVFRNTPIRITRPSSPKGSTPPPGGIHRESGT